MKRSAKAGAAVAVAAALLIGAEGTFAEWSESRDVGSGQLTAGRLDWTVGAGTWSDITSTPAAIADITAFRMVPGDVVRYETTVTPVLVGNNLTATLTADVSAAAGTLSDNVTIATTVNGVSTDQLALTPADSGVAIAVAVTITFPFAQTAGETEQLDLSTLTLDLVQDANP